MDSMRLSGKVREAYSAAAMNPDARHPFPVGRAFAASLGYPPELLEQMPSTATDAFAGVSYVPGLVALREGSVVLDLGCGAGLDSLLLASRFAGQARVIGADFSGPMLTRARQAAGQSGITNVLFCQAEATRLPLAGGAVDVAAVNGIFNLNPARASIFRELARCVRPGGAVYGAELILREPLPHDVRADESNWFA
ncbi:MAG: methyltransferase domain-containing protein [Bryobacterales bacterium]|nr:methyltransferase domain-containing protein [Bryobacterales bacterium]